MMKRTLRYALIATMGVAGVGQAVAQDMFPDTPDNHWAYESLLTLKKDGLLVGYPDGLFRGGRPASRYELAVAIHAAYQRLKSLTSGLSGQIDALTASLDGKADKTDLDGLRATLAAINKDVTAMKGWGDEIGSLKKLAATFEKEIASLGVDVEAMKKDLEDLNGRVAVLEKKRPAVDIHGTVDLVAIGGYSGKNGIANGIDQFGLGVDGRKLGVGRDDYNGDAVGLTRDLTVLHEGAFEFRSTNEQGAKWMATLVVGNALDIGSGFGNQVDPLDGVPFREGDEYVYFQNLEVQFDTSLAGQDFNMRAGRFGYQISPYILKRPDSTPYYANDRWDNGDWMFDGGLVRVPIGAVTFDIFAGRNGSQNGAGFNRAEIQPMAVGKGSVPIYFDGSDRPRGETGVNDLNMPVDQSFGATMKAQLGKNVVANLSYLWLLSNTETFVDGVGANHMHVFGGDVTAEVGPASLKAGYAQSDLTRGMHGIVTSDNSAWFASLSYETDKWGAAAGYKRILPLFSAPGDWGRIGIWWNPTDIEGFELSAHAKLTEKLTLSASGEFYQGTDNGDLDGVTVDRLGFDSRDKVDRYVIGLDYKCAPDWTMSVGYEAVMWDLKARTDPFFVGGKPVERWFNLGFAYAFNDATRFNVLWQMSDYDSKGVPGFGPFGSGLGDPDKARGGLVTTQLTVKF
jgi:hypothetical protein